MQLTGRTELGDYMIDLLKVRESCLRLRLRALLILRPHAKKIAAPQPSDVIFAVATTHELERHVERFRRIAPAGDPATAVEIRADADVINPRHFHGVIDMIDEIDDIRRWPPRFDLSHPTIVLGELVRRH